MVVLNVKNPIGHGVKTDGNAADAWKSLTDIQDAVSDVGRINAETELQSIHHTDGASLDEHIKALRTAWNKLNAQGGKMADSDFRIIILSSMPKEWTIFITTLYSTKTSADVIIQLKMYDNILAKDRKPSVPAVQALATPNNQHSTIICSNPTCRHTGHSIERCFRPGGGMEGQYPDWWRKKGNTNTPTTSNQKPTANIAVVTHTMTSRQAEHYALMTKASHIIGKPVTYADSAASNHCFIDINDFATYKTLVGKDGNTATVGGRFTIAGMGRVDKRVIFNGRVITLSFNDAMHTPDLSHNLISIGKLDKGGYFSVFGGGGVTFIGQDGHPFLQGQGVGTMYQVDIYPTTGPIPTNMPPGTFIPATQTAHTAVTAFMTHSHKIWDP
jgi:hypothetical protein